MNIKWGYKTFIIAFITFLSGAINLYSLPEIEEVISGSAQIQYPDVHTFWFGPSEPPVEPPQPPIPPIEPPEPPPPGDDDIILDYRGFDFRIVYEEAEKKYKKRYKRGRYKTVVIVFEGKVVACPYDETGPKYEQGTTLTGGQKVSQEGETE